jgi:hypothetical protein
VPLADLTVTAATSFLAFLTAEALTVTDFLTENLAVLAFLTTVMVTVLLTPLFVAVILALPAPTPFTLPLASTVAIFLLFVLKVVVPLPFVTEALTVVLAPTSILDFEALRATVVGASLTVTTQSTESASPSLITVKVIVVVPGLRPVTE